MNNAYRHNTCWDNFISYRIKRNEHVCHTNTCWDNFVSYRIKRI